MPAIKGLLKEADYTKLQMNYVSLVRELDGQFLVDEMLAADAFGESDIEEILSQNTREKRTRVFLKKLLHSGPGPAFSVFLQTLEVHYPHVAEKLKESTTENDTPVDERPDDQAGTLIQLPSRYEQDWLVCQKNPGHRDFIPIGSFDVHHLPSHFQLPEVVESVRVLAEQTVLTMTSYVSLSRPEGFPGSGYKRQGREVF